MTHTDILEEIRKGKFRPLYFLHGEESYFIDLVCDAIETNALPEAERAFNQTVFYGKDADFLAVLDTARRFPMMAPHQVVIIKEAQEMKTLKDLESYFEKPAASTILVICHKNGKYNLNSKFGKAIKEHAVLLESKRLYDNQVPDWIQDYLKRRQLRIRPEAATLVAEYLGNELSRVANELDKLAINIPPGKEIGSKEIEEHIGISKEFNVFELQKALSERNILKANRIVDYFAANPRRNPMPVILGALYNFFSKVYILNFYRNKPEKEQLEALGLRSAFFLRDYKEALRHFSLDRTESVIGLLRIYDLKSKGVDYISTGKEEGDLLRELVWHILHVA